jgi:manganese/zinc/iron transport system substrate-binding protein
VHLERLSTFLGSAFLCVLLCLCLGFTGCSAPSSDLEEWERPNGKVKVLSTTAMIDDVVGLIGAERIDHIPLIVGEIDPHGYELVKGDDEKLSYAQIIFYNGLGLEHGASLRYALAHHPSSIALGNIVQRNVPGSILYAQETIAPHIWMDISLWSYIVDPIADELSRIDPDGATIYHANATVLKQQMLQEHTAIQMAFVEIPENKRYLVTSHDAFNYFTRAYLALPEESDPTQWSKRFDAPEGLAPEGQLSTADIQAIVDHLVRYQIQVVFPESNISLDSLKKISHACRQKGLEVAISSEVLYGDAMGSEKSGAHRYLDMIRHNADVLLKEWHKEK